MIYLFSDQVGIMRVVYRFITDNNSFAMKFMKE